MVLILMSVLLVVSGCSSGSKDSTASGDLGELVPKVTITSTTPEENQVLYESALMLADEWEELGIDVEVKPMETNALLDVMYSAGAEHDFDVVTGEWTGRAERLDPDMFIYSLYHSSNIDPGKNNALGFANDDYDKAAEAQRVAMDPDERQAHVFDAQQILADNVPLVTTHFPSYIQAYNKNRFDNVNPMIGEGLYNEWMPQLAKPLTDDKTLRIGALVDIDKLNPMVANTSYEWKVLRYIYDKLVRVNLEGEPTGSAASDWEIVNDTTIDVTLREGLTFHDGEPLTVEDVDFTFNYMLDNGVPYFQAFLEPIESVEATDDKTIRFILKEPYASFINSTLGQIPILPKHIWEPMEDPTEYDNLEPIGSGPFILDSWRRGEEIKFKTFKDYHEDIEIDEYIYRIYGQAEGLMIGLENEEIDMITERLLPAHIHRAQDIDHLELTDVSDIGFMYIGFNLRREPFDDLAMRKALAHTVDIDSIVNIHLEGFAVEGGAGMVIAPENGLWFNPDVDRPEYNPDMAREILEEAGYGWDSKGNLHFPQ